MIPGLMKRFVKFPVTPHLPLGNIASAQLIKIGELAKQYHGQLKISGNTIILLGVSMADGEKILSELGLPGESFITSAVRAVNACPGKGHCPRGQQESEVLALALDQRFFGEEMPAKIRMGISGCPNCCAEPMVRDIGLFGLPGGYTVVVGGNSGRLARIADVLAENIPPAAAEKLVAKILAYYKANAKPKERMSTFVERVGIETIRKELK
jgi:NAD(P)H-nitrite reductase large subunit